MAESEHSKLDFKGGNPGSVQYGNFINYYQFHPPENRLKLLPTSIWPTGKSFYALDIGSNAGDLTLSLYDFLNENVENCHVLGIDIDPVLVERSNEKTKDNGDIEFCCLDFMDENSRGPIKDYLKKHKLNKFDAVFCFSITMWIHLNYGDAGLETFLKEICALGDLIIIEPQPWKCYKTAVKRMKLGKAQFPLFKDLKIRQEVTNKIETFITKSCRASKLYESDLTEWGRKLLIYKRQQNT